jgi:hypothetical protein
MVMGGISALLLILSFFLKGRKKERAGYSKEEV